jgi:hypothetical protein
VTAIVGFAVALVPVVGLIFTASTNRRAQYDRVLEVTALLTSGDVVESRHAAGIKFEAVTPSPPSTITNPVVNLTEEELKALFNVLWTLKELMDCSFHCNAHGSVSDSARRRDCCSTSRQERSRCGVATRNLI